MGFPLREVFEVKEGSRFRRNFRLARLVCEFTSTVPRRGPWLAIKHDWPESRHRSRATSKWEAYFAVVTEPKPSILKRRLLNANCFVSEADVKSSPSAFHCICAGINIDLLADNIVNNFSLYTILIFRCYSVYLSCPVVIWNPFVTTVSINLWANQAMHDEQ